MVTTTAPTICCAALRSSKAGGSGIAAPAYLRLTEMSNWRPSISAAFAAAPS